MKTRIDEAAYRFMAYMVENDAVEAEFQSLLDTVRAEFDLDAVSIIEKNGSKNIYTYTFESIRSPEFSKKGGNIILSDEEYQITLHMYDENPICEQTVQTARDFGVSSNIIHYGFIRENATISDGSITFECYGEHTWSDEERAALVKVGKIFKMINCMSIANGVFDSFYEKIDLERANYLRGLTVGAAFHYSLDITDGYIRENVSVSAGLDILQSLGMTLPASYDEVKRKLLPHIKLVDKDMIKTFTCQGLIELFEAGSTHPEVEYYYDAWGTYIRVTIFMYQNKRDGHIHGLVVAVNNTEARKKQELQRQALEDAFEAANQANAAKSRFLSNMSHDIRTPMNAIIGMTAIAAANIDDREKISDCLAKISQASKHLLGIINDVLDMSKIESGQIELQNEEFTLPELIDNTINITNPLVTHKRHELIVKLNNIKHERVIGDRHRLEQIFVNLISNAAKYTPEGGKINITITEKPIEQPKAGLYEFVFEDNGIGMSEDFIQNMFSPFSRANDPRVRNTQGTGLGLAIARNIVQMMNGTIDVESTPDVGTKFIVSLFLELQDAATIAMCERLVDLPVLVADDDECACEATCLLLREIGMLGEYVMSGEEAVERVKQRHNENKSFFAVILDWKMPGMNGLETAKAIRAEVGDDIPIIIISAYDWSDIEQEARAAGVKGFLSKPLFKSKIEYLFKEIVTGETRNDAEGIIAGARSSDFSGKRALLVEDNELNAEIASEILSMVNIKVEVATDGTEAVDMMKNAAEGYYDIVFMDIQMPNMNGYDATRAIRALPRRDIKTLPIIAMTANAFADDVQQSKDAGMNGHISKPIELEKLFNVLNKHLSVEEL